MNAQATMSKLLFDLIFFSTPDKCFSLSKRRPSIIMSGAPCGSGRIMTNTNWHLPKPEDQSDPGFLGSHIGGPSQKPLFADFFKL
jgi:hypothetical protein